MEEVGGGDRKKDPDGRGGKTSERNFPVSQFHPELLLPEALQQKWFRKEAKEEEKKKKKKNRERKKKREREGEKKCHLFVKLSRGGHI